MKKIFVFLLAAVLCGSVCAQKKKDAAGVDVKNIDAYVRSVDAYVKSHKSPNMVFADTADASDSKSKWKKFASEKALEDYRKKTETYEICYVWQRSGTISETSGTMFSPSGDWVEYIYHYFRADGTLAKVESDFRSFNGNIIIERSLYFDRKGKQIKTATQYRDLKTRKFKKPDSAANFASSMNKLDVYKTTKKLPFAHLLTANAATTSKKKKK
jgi:hypothetical protein